jgi:hypothetical protein
MRNRKATSKGLHLLTLRRIFVKILGAPKFYFPQAWRHICIAIHWMAHRVMHIYKRIVAMYCPASAWILSGSSQTARQIWKFGSSPAGAWTIRTKSMVSSESPRGPHLWMPQNDRVCLHDKTSPYINLRLPLTSTLAYCGLQDSKRTRAIRAQSEDIETSLVLDLCLELVVGVLRWN